MLIRTAESTSRTQSLLSVTLLNQNDSYNKADLEALYMCVLKILILEYINEVRFKTPITNEVSSSSSSLTTVQSPSKRKSRIYGLDTPTEAKLSSSFYTSFEQHLNLIAMKRKGSRLDDTTRRCLLRFYSEMLDPMFKSDLKTHNTPDYLLMKFVACANKEITKLGTVPSSQISQVVFKQADELVSILIQLVDKEKNKDLIITKLNEHKDSLKPRQSNASSLSTLANDSNATYTKPSYKITDMDQGMIQLLQDLFKKDLVKVQQDIFKVKDLVGQKTLQSDIKQILFYLEKDLGQFVPKSFPAQSSYEEWKHREKTGCQQLINKYQVPAAMKLLPMPKLPSGEDFYILPSSASTTIFFTILIKLCLELQEKVRETSTDAPLVPSKAVYLMTICSRFWRIDYPTKATCFYTAAHLSGMLQDKLFPIKDAKELCPVDIDNTLQVINYCKLIIEDHGKLSWSDKTLWSSKDQENWINNLTYTYNSTMFSIKEGLQIIFSKVSKPKFGPLLMLLGESIESDVLFPRIEALGLVKKWEKKLSRALLRTSEVRYAELLKNLPRDDTLSIIHVLDISDSIVNDIRALQKRYKNPLLGFLQVPKTVAAVMTSMFAVDSKNILKHIIAYSKKRGEFVPYGDALEAYKSLYEIRDIYNQVNTSTNPFKFNLEKFFFPNLNNWVNESGNKISDIVDQAVKNDSFEPISLEDDIKKYSTSVLDIFTLVKGFLKILDDLKWTNEYQLAKIDTVLLKSISDGVLKYTSMMAEKIMFELNEEEQKKLLEATKDPVAKRKSGGWFDEMKNVVNNIQIGNKIVTEEPYNFRPETCIALNDLAAMLQQLSQLEDILDPVLILKTVQSFEPNRQNDFTSHIFSLRLIRAENLASSGSSSTSIRPYVTLIDTALRKTIGKTRTIDHASHPEWDEEFEVTLEPNSTLTLFVTVWDEKLGSHAVCGRSVLQLDPRKFKHDGIPQEIYLDLDSQGRLLIEVAVESERIDAIFVMGRAHRALMRAQERCIKLTVEKFSRFVHLCFSRGNLRSICGNNGQIRPTQQQMDEAMMPLYEYLNSNLQVLAQFLTKDLLIKVMVAAWNVVVSSADELLLPKLMTAKTFNISNVGSKLSSNHTTTSNWHSAVSTAVANVTSSIGISGFGSLLTSIELETVFAWLNFLCFDFFHNDGNGPPVKELKNEHYQALLLLPVYYDRDVDYLKQEVERLSPAFLKTLRDRNNFDQASSLSTEKASPKPGTRNRSISRASTLARKNTIMANATSSSRAQAKQDELDARSDPIAAQTSAEDIILRLLLIKDEKLFVARRLEQREKLAHSIATERLARAAAEGRFNRR